MPIRAFIAYVLFVILLAILVGIGMAPFGLLPEPLTKLVGTYWGIFGSIFGVLIGALGGAALAGGWNRVRASLKQSLPSRSSWITVVSLSVVTVVVCAYIVGKIAVSSSESNLVTIPLTPYTGQLALTDPLRDNHLGYRWTASPASSTACNFTEAGYQVTATQSIPYQFCWARQTNFSTFAYQADMSFINGAGGGIVFNDGGTVYAAFVDSLGQFVFFTYNSQNQDDLVKGYPYGYIGYHNRIIITLVVKPMMLEVYVGSRCMTCSEPVLRIIPGHGDIGVFAAVENGQPDTQTQVLFENVQVWKL